jgi:hypothetical protein
VTADIDVRFSEEQSAVWYMEHTHTAGHKADVAGDRHTTSKIHNGIAILTEKMLNNNFDILLQLPQTTQFNTTTSTNNNPSLHHHNSH